MRRIHDWGQGIPRHPTRFDRHDPGRPAGHPMNDADLLSLTQWMSPAFPVGAFAWSHGLETAIAEGLVTDAAGLECWLRRLLLRGSAQADAVLLVASMSDDADLSALASLSLALCGSAERAAETISQGRAFTSAHNAVGDKGHAAAPLPVAVGRAARDLSLGPERVAAFYLQSFCANLVSAAVRAIPLGAAEGQRVIARLQPVMLEAAAYAAVTPPEKISISQPGADYASVRHETQEVRIYRS